MTTPVVDPRRTPRSGATHKDTMVRAGQSSEKAAMIYQHSDNERQREVAAGLDGTAACSTRRSHQRASGALMVRHQPAGLDNKEPPGLRPGGFCWSG